MRAVLSVLLAVALLAAAAGSVMAVEVGVSQSGADSDEIMKDRAFTIEVSGWSGDCTTATLSFSGCSGCDLSGESMVKSVGEDTSVTWTTGTASQKASGQTISVSMGGGCGENGESSNFDVVMPPSLTLSATTEETSADKGEAFDVNVEVANDGETTANGLLIEATTSGFTADCSISSTLNEEQSTAQVCSVTGAGIADGSKTVTLEVSSSNADSATDTLTIYINSAADDGICDSDEADEEDCGGDDGGSPGGGNSPGGGLGGGAPAQNRTRAQHMAPGLLNNTRLQAAIERVLGQASMSEQARQNMLQLSARITGDFSSSHGFTYDGSKSRIRNTVRYNGRERVRNFVLFESVPKTFAQSASQVTVTAPGGSVEVAEDDPSWAILYPEVSPGDEFIVTYEVTGMKSESTLDSLTTEVYAESVEEAAAGGTPGTDDGEAPSGGEETAGGEEETGPGTGGISLPAMDMNTMLMIAAGVLAVVVIAAAAFLLKGRKGKKAAGAAASVEKAMAGK